MSDWQAQWDTAVGLWRQPGPGHTSLVATKDSVHCGRSAASRILFAVAHRRTFSDVPVARVLDALRKMQVVDGGEYHGCMKWYWEEEVPEDTNASFFIGLSLIVLRKCYFQELDPTCRNSLDAILIDLRAWFNRALEQRQWFYPNRYLGNLVCAYLLQEVFGDEESQRLHDVMIEAADYWERHAWGWGEHLSDGYAAVCMDQLSLLLLLSERLPAEIRKRYTGLLRHMLAIEDAYGAGPRVPAIRSYSFLTSPRHVNYRDTVRPLRADEMATLPDRLHLGPLLYERGWHNMVAPRVPVARDCAFVCFGRNRSVACIEDDIRLGSLSTFPLMPSAEYHTWGLSWQCFPVAFWRAEGDWGFLQWEATENGNVRSHPAEERQQSFRRNSLTQSVDPPHVGYTHCIQRGGSVLAVRIMPAIAQSWDQLIDRFRLVESHAAVARASKFENWSQLVLQYAQRQVSVNYIDLMDSARPRLASKQSGAVDWEVVHSAGDLHGRRRVVSLWGISIRGQIERAPQLSFAVGEPSIPRSREEQIWHVHWQWPEVEWHVRIDPLSAQPLRLLEDGDSR